MLSLMKRFRQNFTDPQSIIAVHHAHLTARDQLAVQQQVHGFLDLLIEFHDAARTQVEYVFQKHVPYARLEKLESSTLVLQEPRLN